MYKIYKIKHKTLLVDKGWVSIHLQDLYTSDWGTNQICRENMNGPHDQTGQQPLPWNNNLDCDKFASSGDMKKLPVSYI